MTPIPIVALDVPTKEAALALVDELADGCRFYKVGNELFTEVGPAIVHALRERGTEVFLDLKLHDIPNTVAGAVKGAAALGVRLVTVHASGGEAMLRAAVNAAGDPAQTGVQRDVRGTGEQAGVSNDVVRRLTDNLTRYERGLPCRRPWTPDELPM